MRWILYLAVALGIGLFALTWSMNRVKRLRAIVPTPTPLAVPRLVPHVNATDVALPTPRPAPSEAPKAAEEEDTARLSVEASRLSLQTMPGKPPAFLRGARPVPARRDWRGQERALGARPGSDALANVAISDPGALLKEADPFEDTAGNPAIRSMKGTRVGEIRWFAATERPWRVDWDLETSDGREGKLRVVLSADKRAVAGDVVTGPLTVLQQSDGSRALLVTLPKTYLFQLYVSPDDKSARGNVYVSDKGAYRYVGTVSMKPR